jgi:hypothetical protein
MMQKWNASEKSSRELLAVTAPAFRSALARRMRHAQAMLLPL